MSVACPQCGAAAPSATAVGSTYACPGCGNPVLAAASRSPSAPPPPPLPPAPPASRSPWKLAALALVVLGAAHAGLYALLTAEARRDRDAILAGEGSSIVEAPAPGPQVGPEDVRAFNEYEARRKRWKRRQTYEERAGRVTTLGVWLGVAYAAQAAIVLVVLVKASARPKARGPSPLRTPAP